jgi:hypothetical protein
MRLVAFPAVHTAGRIGILSVAIKDDVTLINQICGFFRFSCRSVFVRGLVFTPDPLEMALAQSANQSTACDLCACLGGCRGSAARDWH